MLELKDEEQLKKAEALKSKLEAELTDPLLEESERSKLQAKLDRWNEAIINYHERNKKPEPADIPPDYPEHPLPEPPPEPKAAAYRPPPPTADPRPDLTEDAQLWQTLLHLAADKDAAAGRMYGVVDTLCSTLNGFRCEATRLRAGKSTWVLRPEFDSSGKMAWTSQVEYDDYKQRFLQPFGGEVSDLLRELTARHPLPNV